MPGKILRKPTDTELKFDKIESFQIDPKAEHTISDREAIYSWGYRCGMLYLLLAQKFSHIFSRHGIAL